MLKSSKSLPEKLTNAVQVRRGYSYRDFTPGRVFNHHWGRTLTETDNTLFNTLTLHYNPTYFNVEHARALGHRCMVINPYLVFNVVFGLCVEDLTEGSSSGAFLGVEALAFHEAAYPGDTVSARSTVEQTRLSSSNSAMGIVSWHCEGFRQDGARLIDFRRTNMLSIG